MTKLSIIIPAYNEETRLGSTLTTIAAYLVSENVDAEVIVCDDGSKDGTVELVRRFAVDHPHFRVSEAPRNQGKGAAVRRGIHEATGDFLLFSDADLSAPIGEAKRLLYWLEEGYDVAIGSRAMPDASVTIEAKSKRKIIGRIFNFLVQRMIGLPLHDTQCGFKAFRRDVGKRLFDLQRLDGFSFDVEVLYLAAHQGFSVREVAVNWAHVEASRVNLINDSLKMFRDLLRIRSMHRHTPKPVKEPAGRQTAGQVY
ncbi:MAG: glycosyltransferase family 2 protein [Candidatus Sericytochromatia bacterium]|nr:glycosyltransferase family 2 protein [Candidatus Sericytochromatia bacterium]